MEGLVPRRLKLSYDDLSQNFAQHTVVCALQCAGNRRHTMRTRLKEVDGIDWEDGAVMNCAWRGPFLADILAAAGIDDRWCSERRGQQLHIAFSSHQAPCTEDTYYGASIPLDRCLQRPEPAPILLALSMNSSPLSPEHGFPVRIIAPGIIGARSVKWLDRIRVQASESSCYYQQRDYKTLPSHVASKSEAQHWWGRTPAMQEVLINSVIVLPRDGAAVKRVDGKLTVQGYAIPQGHDGPVVAVEVSSDGGATWHPAELLPPALPDGCVEAARVSSDRQGEEDGVRFKYAWTRWSAEVPVRLGRGQGLLCRASDRRGNTQPRVSEWNLRGVAYNGYGETRDLSITDS